MVGDRLALEHERARLLRQNLGEDRLGGGTREWRPARQHFVQHHAEGVHVGARVLLLLSGRLLGTHVFGRAKARARLRHPRPAVAAPGQRDAEVGDQRPAVVEQHVVRLDVAVNHALAVSVVEPGGDFGGDPDRVGDGELGLAGEPAAQ